MVFVDKPYCHPRIAGTDTGGNERQWYIHWQKRIVVGLKFDMIKKCMQANLSLNAVLEFIRLFV